MVKQGFSLIEVLVTVSITGIIFSSVALLLFKLIFISCQFNWYNFAYIELHNVFEYIRSNQVVPQHLNIHNQWPDSNVVITNNADIYKVEISWKNCVVAGTVHNKDNL